ncbi:hypothetical protein LCGC14_3057610, partial [marine sediment metagenome]
LEEFTELLGQELDDLVRRLGMDPDPTREGGRVLVSEFGGQRRIAQRMS